MAESKLQFGQIPFWAICNFGERSKIEIVVFSYICAKRFRCSQTGECSRQEIAEFTKLDKSQISLAIKKLVSINWLEPKSKTTWFISENEPQKVEESSTNSLDAEVDESITKVDESTTIVEESPTKVEESSTFPYIRNSSDFTDLRTDNKPKNIAEINSAVVEVSPKVKKVPKPKAEDSPEFKHFRQTLSDFQKGYAAPTVKGVIIANATAVRSLFKLARGDTDICLEIHRFQQSEVWRNGRVDWITVHRDFNSYLANKKNGATNGTAKQYKNFSNGNGGKQTAASIIASRPYRQQNIE